MKKTGTIFSLPVDGNLKILPEIIENCLMLVSRLKFPKVSKKFHKIILAGMGGSGIAGEIVRTILNREISAFVTVVSEAGLPAWVDNRTLVIIASYSGDTEEMLQVFHLARARKATVVALSSGGRLTRQGEKYRLPVIALPRGLQPRAALGYFLVALFFVLDRMGVYAWKPALWRRVVIDLKNLRAEISAGRLNFMETVAASCIRHIPVILTSSVIQPAGYRFKTQLNENAKMPALVAVLPEMVHNEIMNLASLDIQQNPFNLIMLTSDFDDRLVRKMRLAVRDLLKKNFSEIFAIPASGRTLLEQILYLIYVTDLISIRVAAGKNIDPTPVIFINQIKAALKKSQK